MTVPVWVALVRMIALITLSVQAALGVRLASAGCTLLPRNSWIPLGTATVAFYAMIIQRWNDPTLMWSGAPLALVFSASMLFRIIPYVKVKNRK